MNPKVQMTNNSSISTSSTSVQISPATSGDLKRTQFIVTNTSAAAVITLVKSSVATAVQGAGIRLQPNSSYSESTDSGFTCWQGAIQAVSDVAGTIGFVETFEMN